MRPDGRPRFSADDAAHRCAELYGISGAVSALPSDRDQNFKVALTGGDAYVLKFFHADEAPELVEAQRRVFDALATLPRPLFPRLRPTNNGAAYVWTVGASGARHLTWLSRFMPGEPIARLGSLSTELLNDLGTALATMDEVLARNPQPAARRTFVWAAQTAPEVISAKLEHVDAARRPLLEEVLASFEADVRPCLGELRVSLIHNDVNDYNLLVEGDRVSAILDFGDMLESYTVCEVAHAACYLMLDTDDPLRVAREVVRGYQAVYPLHLAELRALYDLMRLRLALSVTLSAYRRRLEPDDPYLSISEAPAYRLLERLAQQGPNRDDFVRTFTSLARSTLGQDG